MTAWHLYQDSHWISSHANVDDAIRELRYQMKHEGSSALPRKHLNDWRKSVLANPSNKVEKEPFGYEVYKGQDKAFETYQVYKSNWALMNDHLHNWELYGAGAWTRECNGKIYRRVLPDDGHTDWLEDGYVPADLYNLKTTWLPLKRRMGR